MSLLSDSSSPFEAAMHRVLPRRRSRSIRPLLLEALEARTVLSTITVTSLADSGAGSLREAITQANSNDTDDVIDFAPSVKGQITLLTALPDITSMIDLNGPGASVLSLSRSSDSGTPLFRILNLTVNANVVISGLTISGGRPDGRGGGIQNLGHLTINDSIIARNQAVDGFDQEGGGIYNTGTLVVTRSTFSENGSNGIGGAILNYLGTTTLTDCIVENNRAGFAGGGIATAGGFMHSGDPIAFGVTNITRCLIRENSATQLGAGIEGFNYSSIRITDSTVSENSAGLRVCPIRGTSGSRAT